MAIIESILGPTTTTLGSDNYTFAKDRYGRFVAEVHNLRHVGLLLELATYREVDADPKAEADTDHSDASEWTAKLDEAVRAVAYGDEKIVELNGIVSEKNSRIRALETEVNTLSATVTDLEADLRAADAKIVELNALLEAATDPLTGSTESEPSVADNLSTIAGLGDPSQEKLKSVGITTFDQLAELTPEKMAELDKSLKLGGTSERNDWIGQAKAIVAERANSGGANS